MIFYFTGTGNSLYAAQHIAKVQNDRLVSISDCLNNNMLNYELSENESVGFVFPIYFYGLPTIFFDFIKKINFQNFSPSTYVYAVCTCGGQTGNALGMLKRLLKKNNFHLNSAFSVIMPDNYILLFDLLTPENKRPDILKNAELQLQVIDSIISQKKNQFLLKKGLMPNFITITNYPFYKYGRNTKAFYYTKECISCGLCEKICPSEAIKLIDKKPVWVKSKCYQCLGCIHRCPQNAIQYGKKTINRGRYINPDCDFK